MRGSICFSFQNRYLRKVNSDRSIVRKGRENLDSGLISFAQRPGLPISIVFMLSVGVIQQANAGQFQDTTYQHGDAGGRL